jgi:high-affinity iron transporter
MLATLLIVFREVIEAGLVVGIVLAATQGVKGRGFWIGSGVGVGVLGAGLVAVFAREIAGLFEGWGQEYFNSTILLGAVAMLTWHNIWMASQGQSMAQEARVRALGGAVAAGYRPITALAFVVGVAVLREGTEVVLFLYGIVTAGNSALAMIAGGALGVLGGAALSGLMYLGLTAIPVGPLVAVTTGLITLLAAGMASQAIAFLQQAGYFLGMADALWDSSAFLPEKSILGQLLYSLIGYSESPTGAQLIAYLATIAVNLLLIGLVRKLKL